MGRARNCDEKVTIIKEKSKGFCVVREYVVLQGWLQNRNHQSGRLAAGLRSVSAGVPAGRVISKSRWKSILMVFINNGFHNGVLEPENAMKTWIGSGFVML
jgi:hypothetical protein